MPCESRNPRIAYFPDSFHEVNGVAHTSRKFAEFARCREIPFLCVRAAPRKSTDGAEVENKTRLCEPVGSVQALELGRSPLAVRLEQDLWFDPLFARYSGLVSETVRRFKPDVIHITGPSELGIFGAYFAWQLGIPLVASWHTNLHEYGARRMRWLTRRMGPVGERLEGRVESSLLGVASLFYRRAKVLYAPNPGLCALLEARTRRPCHLMQRGVETEMFTPARRTRAKGDGGLVLGYVGRLSVEKNVALLPRVDADLRARGIVARWVIVGHGAEEAMLRRELPGADLAGVLRGEALARAYANMDLLVFPSHTDTFGNVVLEALASGVPAVVTPDGGPATIVRDRETGWIANDAGFAGAIAEAWSDLGRLRAMGVAARRYAMQCSWDAVFERVVGEYPTVASKCQQ